LPAIAGDEVGCWARPFLFTSSKERFTRVRPNRQAAPLFFVTILSPFYTIKVVGLTGAHIMGVVLAEI
jgi:hypothetical protein